MSSSTITYNATLSPAKCAFIREGYNFAGWVVQRGSDKKWFTDVPGWRTDAEISSNGYSKKVYSTGTSYVFQSSWIAGGSGVCTYTFYALWEKKAAYPHSYAYTNNGDTHTAKCTLCGNSYTEQQLHGCAERAMVYRRRHLGRT